jgi:hypothetical protein
MGIRAERNDSSDISELKMFSDRANTFYFGRYLVLYCIKLCLPVKDKVQDLSPSTYTWDLIWK